MKPAERILYLLKTRGPQTTQFLADDLELTSMGARKHLEALAEKGWLDFEDKSTGVGRPSRYWHLTDAGHERFPDRHGELTLQLLTQIQSLFGESGMERLIAGREDQAREQYQARIAQSADLSGKVTSLAAIRTEEGYMAQALQLEDKSWCLVENHCPICAAARQCQQFCRSELSLFQTLFADMATVEREQHILSGARRCAYRIIPLHQQPDH